MLFNSISYLIFFPIVAIIYFAIKNVKSRIIFLLFASYFFYMCWNQIYIVLIVASTIVDFIIGKKLGSTDNPVKRKLLVLISILVNLGILSYFKYYNFLAENIEAFWQFFGVNMNVFEHHWLLPVGISFYTFQTLSYTIDIYRKQLTPENNFLKFALYVSFFPQLVAGPIERPSNLLPQFSILHKFDYKRITDGLKLIALGFFKKLVVADRMSMIVHEVFNYPENYFGCAILIASIFFVFQVFCDFSGYTDIAIGSAKILGIDLMENFRGPLLSRNVSEIWRRWHISLSTWIRDYLYTPLAFSLRNIGKYSYILVFMISYLLIGFWHGAAWTFITFGVLQGLAMSLEVLTKKRRRKIMKSKFKKQYIVLSVFLTFTFWTYCCLIFRAYSMQDVLTLSKNLMTWDYIGFKNLVFLDKYTTANFYISLTAVFLIIIIHIVEYYKSKDEILSVINRQHFSVRWALYITTVVLIFTIGEYGFNNEFIYFQF